VKYDHRFIDLSLNGLNQNNIFKNMKMFSTTMEREWSDSIVVLCYEKIAEDLVNA
jgi:hypothetical protein